MCLVPTVTQAALSDLQLHGATFHLGFASLALRPKA
jgi:hypothetical protein